MAAGMLSLLARIWQLLGSLSGRVSTIESHLSQIELSLQRSNKLLEQIVNLLTPGPATQIVFISVLEGQLSYGVTHMVLTDVQQVDLSIQPVDKKGNPAPVDGAPQWTSSDPTIVSLTVAPDGMSALAVALGPLGHTQISVTADADLGSGVQSITGTLDIDVQGSTAVSVSIKAGTPVNQPTQPTP